jgi:hypothetical protein
VIAKARSIRVLLDVGQRSEIDVVAEDWRPISGPTLL